MTSITIGKYIIEGTNRQELLGIKKEIFQDSIYYQDLTTRTPRIIDGGAHVGLATLYFKQIWPAAIVTAIEPHPENCRLLRHNIWFNGLTDVEVIEAALGTSANGAVLFADASPHQWYSVASFLPGAWDGSQTSVHTKVPTLPLDDVLTQPVDLLKLDIEGAEVQVLRHAKLLHHAAHCIIELHPPHTPADLSRIFQKTHTVEIKKHHYGLYLCYAHKK